MENLTKNTLREVSVIWDHFKTKNQPNAPSENEEYINAAKSNAETRLKKELENLLEKAPKDVYKKCKTDFEGFLKLFGRFLGTSGSSVDWKGVTELSPETFSEYDSLPCAPDDDIPQMLSKLVVVKLNGGLGTSMGCNGPKSAIPIKDGLTFLDLTVQQILFLNETYNVSVPLVLMNSFNTDEETQQIVGKYRGVQISTFLQSCYPRLLKDTLLPLAKHLDIHNDPEAWYPPGHGNFYETFKHSGLLQTFIDEGREYCFVSNIDNLGATVDFKTLNSLLSSPPENRPEFLVEITDKTRADVKGGTLVQYENKVRLLEIAQVPENNLDDFKSLKVFNTNNLWVKLDAMDRVLSDGSLSMEVIVNPKILGNNVPIIQLETAVGAAMKCFERGRAVRVPRSDFFIPVKKTSDLLVVMSNLYKRDRGYLRLNPERTSLSTPLIKLGDQHFSKVREFLKRFSTIPDIVGLDHLTVSGDVTFGKDVALKGTVIILASHGERIDIPSGSVLENKIVSGNLRVMNH